MIGNYGILGGNDNSNTSLNKCISKYELLTYTFNTRMFMIVDGISTQKAGQKKSKYIFNQKEYGGYDVRFMSVLGGSYKTF